MDRLHNAALATYSVGSLGPQGQQGSVGDRGITGATGFTGSPGTPGQKGPSGFPGQQGEPGFTGPQGLSGPEGQQGQPGDTGPIGPTGQIGLPGQPGFDGDSRVHGADPEWMESLDWRDAKDNEVNQDFEVPTEKSVLPDQLEIRERPVRLELLAHRVGWDSSVWLVLSDSKDLMERQEERDSPDSLEILDRKDPMARLEILEHLDQTECQVIFFYFLSLLPLENSALKIKSRSICANCRNIAQKIVLSVANSSP